jgi:hypothetical protein
MEKRRRENKFKSGEGAKAARQQCPGQSFCRDIRLSLGLLGLFHALEREKNIGK